MTRLAEEIIHLQVNPPDNRRKILNPFGKIQGIYIDDKQLTLFVPANPFFVMFIQILQVFKAYRIFKAPASLLNLLYELWNVSLQINQQIGGVYKRNHRVEKIEVTLVVTVADVATGMEIGGKDVCVFVNRTVLDNGLFAIPDFPDLIKPAVEEVNLKMERPSRHVIIKILEVRILVNGLIQRRPPVVL